jgi:hypothetical protein
MEIVSIDFKVFEIDMDPNMKILLFHIDAVKTKLLENNALNNNSLI